MKNYLLYYLLITLSIIVNSCSEGFKEEYSKFYIVLKEVTAITTPTTDTTPDYTFSSNESGAINYGGSCSSSTTIAVAGNNTITLSSLSDGTYADCTIKVSKTMRTNKSETNLSGSLTMTSFTITTTSTDTTAPVIAEVTAVTTPTNDTTPDYTFSSTEAGTITYGGSCSSGTTSATTDNNTITFSTLDNGTYSNCTIKVTDSSGNESNTLAITDFTVTYWQPVSSISAYDHTCALLNNGSVKCWGWNYYGQLGKGTKGNTADIGDDANEMGDNLTSIDLGTDRTATAIDTGNHHTCALLDNASVKCWGRNFYGQLGKGNNDALGNDANEMGDNLTSINLGTDRTATAISLGTSYTCALLDNASVKCWGSGAKGKLGQGNTENIGNQPSEQGDNLPSTDLGTGRTATAISAGYRHTCALLDNASVKCWGYNNHGQLGQGNTDDIGDNSSEMGDNLPSIDLGTDRTATAISAGLEHTCALLDNASVKCWGRGKWGPIGHGNNASWGDGPNEMGDNLPSTDLGTGRTATAISAGKYHTCAILDDASVKCWGFNNQGQLGQGNKTQLGAAVNEMGDNLPAIDLQLWFPYNLLFYCFFLR